MNTRRPCFLGIQQLLLASRLTPTITTKRLVLALPMLLLGAMAPLSGGTAFAATRTVCSSGCQ